MTTLYQHYIIGIDFGTEQFIVHRQENETSKDGFNYSFVKKEVVSGLEAKKPVGFLLIENAEMMIKKLQDPNMKPYLSADLRENTELLGVMLSVVPMSDTRMLDYKRS